MLLESKNSLVPGEQRRLACREHHLWMRARMIQAARLFFIEQGYLEVETPLLIPAPAPEVHIDAIRAGDRYLHTSPELCMKRLLAAGYPKIFQISKCFRSGERGDLHLPEFTMLEWYRAGIDYHALMQECEDLLLSISHDLGIVDKFYYKGMKIDLKPPWEKISLGKAFDRYASQSLELSLKRDNFEEIMVNEIEPQLGLTGPTFLYDYPASMAALARLKPGKIKFAERFEVYIGKMELANGFSELTDSQEQRRRFDKAGQTRHRLGKHVYPMDEKFLKGLEHMPEAAGIALGIDRLAMIFTNRSTIDEVVTFTSEEV